MRFAMRFDVNRIYVSIWYSLHSILLLLLLHFISHSKGNPNANQLPLTNESMNLFVNVIFKAEMKSEIKWIPIRWWMVFRENENISNTNCLEFFFFEWTKSAYKHAMSWNALCPGQAKTKRKKIEIEPH